MNNQNSTGILTGFLLRLIIVVLITAALIYFLPVPNLITFYNSVFSDNVETIKKSALNYYTKDKLPKLSGSSTSMTVKEMIDKNIMVAFVDKDGKSCNDDFSYVEVKNNGDSTYTMKIYLSCKDEANYIKVPMGCTDMCNKK